MSYVVTGEIISGRTWPVASYRHEISAETHAELANRWCQERGLDKRWGSDSSQNPFDKDMVRHPAGTEYYVNYVEDGDVVALGQLEAEVWA